MRRQGVVQRGGGREKWGMSSGTPPPPHTSQPTVVKQALEVGAAARACAEGGLYKPWGERGAGRDGRQCD
jgi:hypothetical protein